MRRVVLLDCDGVLADFIGEVIETIVAAEKETREHMEYCKQ